MPKEPANVLPVTTSVPPDFPEDQKALFREVLTVLNKGSIPYAVSGAFALQQHTGIWRFTKDLDVFLTAEVVFTALQLLGRHNYVCEICDPVWLAKAHRDDFYVDLITGMSNGVITVAPSWIERSQPALIVEVETRVLAPEELIASKLFVTRRERFDGADIAHVIYATRGKMDWERILSIAGENWEILLWNLILFRYIYPACTEYVPLELWNDLLTRYMALIAKTDCSARFRGSLIDEKMFAIDVKEWGMADILAEYRDRRIQATRRLDQAGMFSNLKSTEK
ncbi:MAG TPA: nucleotidyltransferase [Terriglobales bacterium]|nr:nucleotidyltransferase [Terriglobales bacterium]